MWMVLLLRQQKIWKQSIDLLVKLKKPVVLVDRYFPGQNVSHVVIDNYEEAYGATEFFIKKGHHNIALVKNVAGMIQMQLREKGYADAMKRAGFYNESHILEFRLP